MESRNYDLYLGLDISKDHVDYHMFPSGKHGQVQNNPKGMQKLIGKLSAPASTLAVMEATGGYEVQALRSLSQAGVAVARVNAKHIHHFGKAIARSAKTDKIDALVIAKYARDNCKDLPITVMSEDQEKMRRLSRRRDQLKKSIKGEKNRKAQAKGDPDIASSIQNIIHALEKELKEIEKKMDARIESHAELHKKCSILLSFKGIGPVCARYLIGLLPELGKMHGKKVTALVGVVPYNRDSGTYKGKRFCSGGRQSLRNALYMPTVSAINHNPAMRDMYQRLVNNGKEEKVALIACMRKMIVWLNTMIRENIVWTEMDVCQRAET